MTRRNAINLTLILLLTSLTLGAVNQPGRAEPRVLNIYRLPVETRDQVLDALPQARAVYMEVTAYCPCKKCCGPKAQGLTASGRRVSHNDGRFVAADTSVLPFHTKLVIPGYASNLPVEVLDRGGAIKGHKLDVFYPTHDEALKWGRRMVECIVVE
jgi:3D (Asp-Asp-Asp) domain-containing protein